MRRFNWLSIFIISILLFSCGKSLPSLDNFDELVWKDDKNACKNQRQTMVTAIEAQKEKLLALDEMAIVKLLGKPDRNELYKRNQKFYYYYLQPGEDCSSFAGSAKRLAVRFNAMGLAKEIIVE